MHKMLLRYGGFEVIPLIVLLLASLPSEIAIFFYPSVRRSALRTCTINIPCVSFGYPTMPDNWKETLFIWDGIFSVKKPSKEGDPSDIKWSGTWVGVDEADAIKIDAPRRGAFDASVESDMTFEVEGTVASTGNDKDDGGAGPFIANITGGSGWDLQDDGAESKSKHSDTVHDVHLQQLRWLGSPDKTANLIFARGNNNFAPFISVGWMRPGNRITLARRYLDESDPRGKWDLEDLKKAVLEEICTGSEGKGVVTPPWKCSVMHLEDQTAKRRKVEKKKNAEEKE